MPSSLLATHTAPPRRILASSKSAILGLKLQTQDMVLFYYSFIHELRGRQIKVLAPFQLKKLKLNFNDPSYWISRKLNNKTSRLHYSK